MGTFTPEHPLLRLIDDSGARPVFELDEDFSYTSDAGRTLTARRGYRTDLCSVPELAMSLVGYPGGRAGIIHDWGCGHPDEILREDVDTLFAEMLAVCGVGPVTVQLMYSAVAGYTAQLRKQAAGPDPFQGA